MPAETTTASAKEAIAEDPDEALYMARFNRLREGGSGGAGLSGYDTLEPLAGAAEPSAFRNEPAATLSSKALATARDYAAQRNSSAFLVWRDGVIEEESYFGEFDQSTPIVSKSLAKPITGIVVGRAIEQGHIKSLDQSVSDFITEWKGNPQKEAILVRHLLDMRTGFLPQSFASDPEDVLNRAYLHPRHDEIIINEYPVVNWPGSRYEYANATSEMVAPLIERATGMRYGDYLSSALLQPLDAAGGSVWVNRPGGTAHSGCCALLPARTYLRMAVLLMQDGMWDGERLLPEGYVAEMRTGTAENPYYGLGLWVPGPFTERRGFAHPAVPFGKVLHSEPYADKDIALFDGNGNQVVYMIPSANMVVIRLGGRPPRDVAEWDNVFLPNLLIRDAFRDNPDAMPQPQAR
ncbi:serine hydrolase domain-containing protein [Erythrobacter sp. HA6-11]